MRQIVDETLPALRGVQKAGKARFVGITGYPLNIFEHILKRAEIDTILSYNHFSLNDTTLLGLLPLLKEHDIGVMNASPLSQGLLSNRGTPVWHPAPVDVKRVCARAAEYCKTHGSDIAQLALQFSVQNPAIPTTLIGTADPANLNRNVQWLEETLDEHLLQAVMEILSPIKDRTWIVGRPENN